MLKAAQLIVAVVVVAAAAAQRVLKMHIEFLQPQRREGRLRAQQARSSIPTELCGVDVQPARGTLQQRRRTQKPL